MDFNTLTTTLTNFTGAFSAAFDRLIPVRNGLLGSLLAIEVVLIGIWWALGHGDQIASVFKKILFIGLWIWITTSFATLAKAFCESLVQAGLIAGGRPGDLRLIFDPSRIASYGLALSEPLVASMDGIGTFDITDAILYGCSFMVLMAAFFAMAIQVFLAVLEYYLLTAVASVLLPFGVLPQTKFLAEKAIAALVAAAIKLMVIAFIIAISDPVLRDIRFAGGEIRLNELMSVLFTSLAIALLTWKAPGLAAGLLAGSPSLSAGELAHSASAGAMIAGGAVAGIVGATRLAVGAAAGGVGLATRAAGAMWTGASVGAASAGAGASVAGGALGAARAAGSMLAQGVGSRLSSVRDTITGNFRKGKEAVLGPQAAVSLPSATAPRLGPSSPAAADRDPMAAAPAKLASTTPPPAWAPRALEALRNRRTDPAQPQQGSSLGTPVDPI